MDRFIESEPERGRLRRETESLAATVAQPEGEHISGLWARFAQAATVEAFCVSWLELQCCMIGHVEAGMVLLGPADRGPFRPVATWPVNGRFLTHLSKTAERTLKERRKLVTRGGDEPVSTESRIGRYEIGYPIEARGALHGAAVLEVVASDDVNLQAMMRQLQWGAAWLELLFSREAVTAEKETRERIQAALDLVKRLDLRIQIAHHRVVIPPRILNRIFNLAE